MTTKKRKSILLVKDVSSDSEVEVESAQNGLEEDQQKSDDEMVDNEEDNADNPPKLTKKKKPGIIYLSSIPQHMNVAILRDFLSQYGEVGRIFLQPDKKFLHRKKKKNSKKLLAIHFTEGWVEFTSKRVAKWVAQNLNTKPITTKKSSRFCDVLWTMKYLPRFKWMHLSERLTYEKAVYKQKLQAEISQARKEANFFQENLDRSNYLKKMKKKQQKANE